MSLLYKLKVGRQKIYNESMRASIFEYFVWILFENVLTNSLFVVLLYWSLLRESHGGGVNGITANVLAAAFCIFELYFNKLNVVPVHAIFIFLGEIAYLAFVIVWFVRQNE